MTYETAEKKEAEILNKYGWTVECLSPFEIYHEEEEGLARGYAAEIILKLCLKKEAKRLRKSLQVAAKWADTVL